MTPRFLVLGGGGYNPWSVGRLWTGVWAILNDFTIPDILPEAAQAVLENLKWKWRASPKSNLLTTLRDLPRYGNVRQIIQDRIRILKPRLLTEV